MEYPITIILKKWTMVIMVADIKLWAIQNAMKLLAIFAVTTIALGAISYWKHTIAEETRDKCNAAWIERDRQDIEHSKLLRHERNAEIRTITKSYEDHNEHELSKYREYVETLTALNAAANANVSKLRQYQAARKVSCPTGRQTETNDTIGASEGSGEAVQIAKSLKALEIVMEEYVKKYFEVK